MAQWRSSFDSHFISMDHARAHAAPEISVSRGRRWPKNGRWRQPACHVLLARDAGNWHSLCRCEVYKKHQQTVFSTGYNWINDRWLESASWIIMVYPMHCAPTTYPEPMAGTTHGRPRRRLENHGKTPTKTQWKMKCVRMNKGFDLSCLHGTNKIRCNFEASMFRVPEYVLSFPCWSSGRVLSWLGLWTFRNFLGDWSLSFEQLYANKPNIEQPLALRMEGTLHQLKDVLSHYL